MINTNEDINVGIRLAQYSKILMFGINDSSIREKLPVLEYSVVNNHSRNYNRIRGFDGNEIMYEFSFSDDNSIRHSYESGCSLIQYANNENFFSYFSYEPRSMKCKPMQKIELFDVHNEAEVFQQSLLLSNDFMRYCGLYWGLREITKTNTGTECHFDVITINENELLRYVDVYVSVLEELRVALYD